MINKNFIGFRQKGKDRAVGQWQVHRLSVQAALTRRREAQQLSTLWDCACIWPCVCAAAAAAADVAAIAIHSKDWTNARRGGYPPRTTLPTQQQRGASVVANTNFLWSALLAVENCSITFSALRNLWIRILIRNRLIVFFFFFFSTLIMTSKKTLLE